MSYKILVMSCDKNEDLWFPFHHCIEKYWKDHPEIIYSTETKINPYYKTICVNTPISCWTYRVYETIKKLECDNILLMVDDIFIRDYVNVEQVNYIENFINFNIASFNFERSFDNGDKPLFQHEDILIRNDNGKFKLSLMCQLWKRKAMLRLFQEPLDPWTFENKNNALNYKYLISSNGNIIKWGRTKDSWKFGVIKGKWARECKEFFDKEGIDIDYSIRGFFD